MQTEPEILQLDGVLGLRGIGTLHTQLLRAVREHTAIRIDCTNADSIDASFIQLLLAIRRTAEHDGVRLKIAVPPDGVLHRALLRCGLPPGALSGSTEP